MHEGHILMVQLKAASDSNPEQISRTEKTRRLTGIALICFALFCFSFLDTIAKYLSTRVGILETAFARYLFSMIIISIFINSWTHPGLTIASKPWMQVGRSLLLFAATIMNFLALQHLQLTQTMSIMFLTPLLVALLSGPILGEWVGPRRMAAIAIGFLGVLLVTRPGTGAVHPAAFYSLAGTICYAFYSILTRILAKHDSTATTLFYSGLGGVVLLLPAVPFFWVTPETAQDVLLMIAMGGFGALGHWVLIKAYKLAPAPILSPFIYSQIIWMMLLGYIFYSDVPDFWTLAGATVVIASGLYLLHRERVTNHASKSTNPV